MLPVTTTSARPSPVTSPIATAELSVVPSEIAWYGRKSEDVAFTPVPAANGIAIAAVAVKRDEASPPLRSAFARCHPWAPPNSV